MRFNFRGVGNSTGNHTSGKGELSDVQACIDK
jgi:alpha/beta superfamily hydrolase